MFKFGDKVYCSKYEEYGTVTEIHNRLGSNDYPVYVTFEDNSFATYTMDGRRGHNSPPTLLNLTEESLTKPSHMLSRIVKEYTESNKCSCKDGEYFKLNIGGASYYFNKNIAVAVAQLLSQNRSMAVIGLAQSIVNGNVITKTRDDIESIFDKHYNIK